MGANMANQEEGTCHYIPHGVGETSTATSEQPRGHTEMCSESQDAVLELHSSMHA